jgi:hypothetical protein
VSTIDLAVFILPVSGALAFALLLYRLIVRSGDPPEPGEPPGGIKVIGPSVGPNDLARSA